MSGAPKLPPLATSARKPRYDVVIAGGCIMGSSAAWFLTEAEDFNGSILVVEPDPTYAKTSTAASTSSVRHQFSQPINVEISLFQTGFIRKFHEIVGKGDPEVPPVVLREHGYLYLASEMGEQTLRENQETQRALGAATRLYTPQEISQRWPFISTEGIALASHNPVGEGWFDGDAMFRGWRRMARLAGAEYVTAAVEGIKTASNRVTSVRLSNGQEIGCDWFVNAAGPRAASLAAMAGIDLPVEPRKRTSFIIDAAEPPDGPLPLIADPAGFYIVSDGPYFRTAITPDPDPQSDPDDLDPDLHLFEERIWEPLANRIPAFEAAKVINAWSGHYAWNLLDQNAVTGPHDTISNYLFMNGFSGHGLQQSAAMGRGISEWVTLGRYDTLDLRPLGFSRIRHGKPLAERNVI